MCLMNAFAMRLFKIFTSFASARVSLDAATSPDDVSMSFSSVVFGDKIGSLLFIIGKTLLVAEDGKEFCCQRDIVFSTAAVIPRAKADSIKLGNPESQVINLKT
jgi:hypothetical protein